MTSFPQTKNFQGYFAPSRVEAEVRDLPVMEGEIPQEISGWFHRVAPDPQFPPRANDDIWFNGDGIVTAFHFHGGKVDLRQKWVRTDKFEAERNAGKALFGAYRNPLTDDPSVEGMYRGTANTNVVFHAGKLLALKEDSPPVAMDPISLETIGNFDFYGAMRSPTFTAHPKIDPETGAMIAFGYAAKGLCTPDMAYYEIDADGRVTREVWFELPYYCMMHDFGVTRDYAVFHAVPIVGSWDRLREGKPHFGFDTGKDIFLGVLRRNSTDDSVRWFRGPNQFASHVFNAFNEGSVIHFDTVAAEGNAFPFFPDVDGRPFDPDKAQGYPTRWTVDMAANSDAISARRLAGISGEFPRIDDRFAMRAYDYGYMLAQDRSRPFEAGDTRSASGLIMNTLARIQMSTGEVDSWWCGPSSTLQEPAFIPRPGSVDEGDGWLVVVENRLVENGSHLLLLNGRDLAAGAVARIEIPFRLRPALHGNWLPAEDLARWFPA